MCLHRYEGALDANTGNGYYGGWQTLRSTWFSVGGPDDPAFHHPGNRRYPFTASGREQLFRVWLIWKRDGNSWREWGTRHLCGLR